MVNVLIEGKAGQGVKLISKILINVLKDNGYHIAATYRYSPLMRLGESNAYIIISKQKIENPLVEEADLEYNLRDNRLETALLKKCKGKKLFINMVLLGILLKKLNIRFDKKRIKKYLPKNFLEENLEAISFGYK